MKVQNLLNRKEKKILQILEAAGYEAYFVGGCVRDALMVKEMPEGVDANIPQGDVDVATNALPNETKDVFESFRVIETGIKHGTVTVLLLEQCDENNGEVAAAIPVEITTYRTDGTYSDSRHPDQVRFVRNIEEDLARRDFTVNAMACDIRGQLGSLRRQRGSGS